MNKDSRKVAAKLLEALVIANDSSDAVTHVVLHGSIWAVLETVLHADAMDVLAEYGPSAALEYINT